jgi:hypothetical protein
LAAENKIESHPRTTGSRKKPGGRTQRGFEGQATFGQSHTVSSFVAPRFARYW